KYPTIPRAPTPAGGGRDGARYGRAGRRRIWRATPAAPGGWRGPRRSWRSRGGDGRAAPARRATAPPPARRRCGGSIPRGFPSHLLAHSIARRPALHPAHRERVGERAEHAVPYPVLRLPVQPRAVAHGG